MEPYVYDRDHPQGCRPARRPSLAGPQRASQAQQRVIPDPNRDGSLIGGVTVPATTGTGRQAVFAPLDDGAGRSAAVVRRLGSAIALGLIADGEQLPPEAELATSLGVATVTLREALSDLRGRGLVETRRGRGGGSFVRLSEPALSALSRHRVRELGSADLRELGEYHAAVAGTAARLTAERASSHEIDRLTATLDGFDQAGTTALRRRIEGRYFVEMAAAAQSVRLTRQEIELQSELAELQRYPEETAGWATATLRAHRAVVEAVSNRDGALARRLTEEYIAMRTLGMIDLHLSLTAAGGEDLADDSAAPRIAVRENSTTTSRSSAPETYVALAESLVERVFDAVSALRQMVLDHRSAVVTRGEQLQSKHLAELRPGLIELLGAHRDIVVGMGLIVAAGLLPNERRRLEWWQYAPGREHPSALQVDLNSESLGFYDCDNAEWFSVPRRTGRRHIVGPYVDAHGTDRYLLTFTAPVHADGTFLGVVGADVPVSRFERYLLGAWGRVGDAGPDVLIANSQDRVVVSNCTRALSGDLLAVEALPASTARLDLRDVPWHLLSPGAGSSAGRSSSGE